LLGQIASESFLDPKDERHNGRGEKKKTRPAPKRDRYYSAALASKVATMRLACHRDGPRYSSKNKFDPHGAMKIHIFKLIAVKFIKNIGNFME